jgi:hypothetical protein
VPVQTSTLRPFTLPDRSGPGNPHALLAVALISALGLGVVPLPTGTRRTAVTVLWGVVPISVAIAE